MQDLNKIRLDLLDCVSRRISECTECSLSKARTQTVPGIGSPMARVVFFGEGPGFEEDKSGLPFVGRAGKLLDNIIASIGCSRDSVFIMNAVKCRPPGNRKPLEEEVDSCRPFFAMQLEIIRPCIIVALGATATEALCGRGSGITRRRGKIENYDVTINGVVFSTPVMPTFHPAYLLRNPAAKADTWHDLQVVKAYVEKND